MATTKFKISSTRNLPKGSRTIPAGRIAAINGRLKTAMQPAISDNQKKQRKSIEKASKTVLNAQQTIFPHRRSIGLLLPLLIFNHYFHIFCIYDTDDYIKPPKKK
jgi:hypothetical protein